MSHSEHVEHQCTDQIETCTKRSKPNVDERAQRSRERNRVHAKNTRERKKNHLRQLQLRMNELMAEREKLKEMLVDTSVACILVNLSSPSSEKHRFRVAKKESRTQDMLEKLQSGDGSGFEFVSDIQSRVIKQIEEEDDFEDLDVELLNKDKTKCDKNELELIRRERNRMHSKKTRLRKKRLLTETQATVQALENQVLDMRRQLMHLLPNQVQLNSKSAADHTQDTRKFAALECGDNSVYSNCRHSPYQNSPDDDSEYDSEDMSQNVPVSYAERDANTHTHDRCGTRSDTSSEALSCTRSICGITQESQHSTDSRKRAVHEIYCDPRRNDQGADIYRQSHNCVTSQSHLPTQAHMHQSSTMAVPHMQFNPYPHARPLVHTLVPHGHAHPHSHLTFSQTHELHFKPMAAQVAQMALCMRANMLHLPTPSQDQYVQMSTWPQHLHFQPTCIYPHHWMRAT